MDEPLLQSSDRAAGPLARPMLAAAYLRMSTDLQVNSTDNQMEIIATYADRAGFTIAKIYRDEGKSGLRLAGRNALRQLLLDASSGEAGFVAVLVSDVSRWGRFQDPDEAAEIELRCRRAGISVHYCAESFQNDGSLGSSILKTVKRVMAGEYSRELSAKVWHGQASLVRQGYHLGGRPGYGLRRLLIDAAGRSKGILARGEVKSIASDRVILVPGPPEEIAVIKRIFALFAVEKKSAREIASILNREGIVPDTGAAWNAGIVERILVNEKYVGNSVWGRTSSTLRTPRCARSPSNWVRCDQAFAPVVDITLFDKACARMSKLAAKSSDETMLDGLRQLLMKSGKLTAQTINTCGHCPSSAAYIYRFGSLRSAYEKIGYRTKRDYRVVLERSAVRAREEALRFDLMARLDEAGHRSERAGKLIRVDKRWTVLACIASCRKSNRHRELRWHVPSHAMTPADFKIAARLDASNRQIIDYYIFPSGSCAWRGLVLTLHNERVIDAYRRETLDEFIAMTRRVRMEEIS